MRNPFTRKSWSPYLVGAGIGVLSWFAFLTADRPLGISTSFENTAAITEKVVAAIAAEQNEYFRDESPKVDWEWMLVLGVFFGALMSPKLSGDRDAPDVPSLWRWRFGDRSLLRYLMAFLGGAIMLFGARLAEGCTSGHGISGTLQLAVSSWLFLIIILVGGTATAFLLFGREGRNHV
tara:strand:- start:5584 stop:6117 length:534 start_codon:yes stop_codon:yes gene_type:complete